MGMSSSGPTSLSEMDSTSEEACNESVLGGGILPLCRGTGERLVRTNNIVTFGTVLEPNQCILCFNLDLAFLGGGSGMQHSAE